MTRKREAFPGLAFSGRHGECLARDLPHALWRLRGFVLGGVLARELSRAESLLTPVLLCDPWHSKLHAFAGRQGGMSF